MLLRAVLGAMWPNCCFKSPCGGKTTSRQAPPLRGVRRACGHGLICESRSEREEQGVPGGTTVPERSAVTSRT
ncbi:hypothetical protein AAFF_G00166900 [Aldrovandia affinis]|uniref:Uncharacterized protein n=1 Tax=Aldrovandia affinis TaxID=143900 RepID=A0AAD7W757_9TELE|nr:hypothetical protein AAFF_G00166900 [Aldrovandia affinis]